MSYPFISKHLLTSSHTYLKNDSETHTLHVSLPGPPPHTHISLKHTQYWACIYLSSLSLPYLLTHMLTLTNHYNNSNLLKTKRKKSSLSNLKCLEVLRLRITIRVWWIHRPSLHPNRHGKHPKHQNHLASHRTYPSPSLHLNHTHTHTHKQWPTKKETWE